MQSLTDPVAATPLATDPAAIRAAYQRAVADWKAGRLPDAQAGFQAVLRARPGLAEAQYYIARVLAAQGERAAAQAAYAAALEAKPKEAAIWLAFIDFLRAGNAQAQLSDLLRQAKKADLPDALRALDEIGFPALIRPSFTMGGTGGGIAYNRDEFRSLVSGGLAASPVTTVLVEESVLGWKEFEMEVVRDKDDNCIIVCSIENLDPMGVHTGDSITVAPALTLTDKEFQIMRNASIACLREIGVDTGGSNVQFAVNPQDGRLVVIEMNPRVSRSSALASKATGFPIAKVAAKLACGYTLDELDNDITRATPASFEPTIDYVVTKMPRFTFEKFAGADNGLTTSMKSVGEAMSIGRTFAESLQKALRSMETGLTGLNEIEIGEDKDAWRAAISKPTPDRLLKVAQAMRLGMTQDEIYRANQIDRWFLAQIEDIVTAEKGVRETGLPTDRLGFLRLKKLGFSDMRLAELSGKTEAEVMAARHALDIRPVYKRIDTCAAEFPSPTPYMYSCYEGDGVTEPDCEADVSDRRKIVILGGGPNRIGQGIEFDYCCCHACFALSDAGYETIMVNCNPETVSTDYDTSDRLYFEPLTFEHVMEILRVEQENGTLHGVIVQFGGAGPGGLVGGGDCVPGLLETQVDHQFLEPLAILGQIDRVRRRSQDRDPLGFQRAGQLQRSLAAELHDHAVERSGLLLDAEDFHDMFEGQRFEIEAVGGVVIGRDRLGVAVDHDGLVARVR
jgi:carbamoyl-phosphate synthase large subunit